jgi:hypothetical protein
VDMKKAVDTFKIGRVSMNMREATKALFFANTHQKTFQMISMFKMLQTNPRMP